MTVIIPTETLEDKFHVAEVLYTGAYSSAIPTRLRKIILDIAFDLSPRYFSEIRDIESGWLCEACKTLCHFYEQGMVCDCYKPWEREYRDEKDFPPTWTKVRIHIIQDTVNGSRAVD